MTGTLIPRRDLFGNPERFAGSISPDGEWLSWVAPRDGVNNLWVAPRDAPTRARALTQDTHRGIASYQWTHDGRYLLYVQDMDGDENWRIHAVPVSGGAARDITPPGSTRSSIVALSRHRHGEMLATSDARDPRFADLVLIDIETGAARTVAENPGFAGFLCDDWLAPRLGIRRTLQGALEILRPEGDGWMVWIVFPPEDARTSGPLHLDARGETLFLLDSRGRDKAALVRVRLDDDRAELIAADERADIGGMIADAQDYRPLAYAVTHQRQEHVVIDEAIRADIDRLNDAGLGDWLITSRSTDDRWWTVAADSDRRPSRSFLYDRHAGTLDMFYETRPALAVRTMARMRPITIAARDGLPLVCYLTLPRDVDMGGPAPQARRPQPLVLSVHGGPWSRDGFGFNGEHQWLADRGYAVLNVNFRGSVGFGKSFLAAGDGEWGARMDDDLSDAVAWAVAQGIADPARIAIMGASYGGYATLAALTRHPERYACGIDIFGPSNLHTLMEAIPAYWESERTTLYRAVGDPRTADGRRLLHDRSPLHRSDSIRRPLLIGQGANDPRVLQSESDQMVAAMEKGGIPVTYVVYPDEGHGFHRPANHMSFNALVEAFLSHHLGGRFEQVASDEFAGTSYRLSGEVDWIPARLRNQSVS